MAPTSLASLSSTKDSARADPDTGWTIGAKTRDGSSLTTLLASTKGYAFVLNDGLESSLGYPKDLQNLIDIDRIPNSADKVNIYDEQTGKENRVHTGRGSERKNPYLDDLLAVE